MFYLSKNGMTFKILQMMVIKMTTQSNNVKSKNFQTHLTRILHETAKKRA